MFEEVKAVLAEQLQISPEKISLTSKIQKDLGADSLDILQLLMAIEEKYHMTIPDEELANFTTVENIVNYLQERLK